MTPPSNFSDGSGRPLPVVPVQSGSGTCNVINLAANACTLDGKNVTGCNAIAACADLAGVTFGIDQNGMPASRPGMPAASATPPRGFDSPGCKQSGVPCYSGGVTVNDNFGGSGYAAPITTTVLTPHVSSSANPAPPPITTAATQPVASSQPTTTQVIAAASTPPVNASTVPTVPTNSTGSGGFDLSFLTDESIISTVPNWLVLAGGIAAVMFIPRMMGGRR